MPARYTTVAEVRNALAPPATADPASQAQIRSTAASLDDATIADQIAEAASTVDSYLGGRYVTPVAEVAEQTPEPVGWWTRDIAAWLASLVNRRNAPVDVNDPVRLRYSATMAALTAVRDNKAVLQLPRVAGDAAQAGYAEVVNPYEGSLFLPSDAITTTGAESFLDRAGTDCWADW